VKKRLDTIRNKNGNGEKTDAGNTDLGGATRLPHEGPRCVLAAYGRSQRTVRDAWSRKEKRARPGQRREKEKGLHGPRSGERVFFSR